jgi:membrane-bound lytic murein transglycosylase D
MKSKIIFASMLLAFFYGCTANLHQTPVSPKEPAMFKTAPSDSPETAKKDNPLSSTLSAKKISPPKKYTKLDTQPALNKAADFCKAAQEFWEKGETDKALETLDQAYALILDTNPDENPELMRQKEELRLTISKRILELYASRNVTVKGKHNAIPLVMNPYVREEIELLTRAPDGKESFFVKAYRRSGMYRPYIVEELKKAGLPAELSWLPLIESGFKVNALSSARALGLWQFIPSTGSKFGLRRDRLVDERLDPEKSTHAAIAYMKELHQIFGDWTTVLAAYNCGEGKVLRVIREQNFNYLDNFWDLYEQLPRETARYVPRFLATLHIVSNPKKYGLDLVALDYPPEYKIVTVSKRVHLKDIASLIGSSREDLRNLNPELRYNVVPGENYALRIPPDKKETLLAKLDQLPDSSPIETAPAPTTAIRYHKIKRGETLAGIARKYRTTVKQIARANKMGRRSTIVAGRTLKIPQKETSVSIAKNENKPQYRRTSKHVVKKGDSLWNLARRYGTSAKDIRKYNKLSNSNLRLGQVIKIPGTVAKKSSKDLRTYRVKRGDIPREIANRYNMPLDRFLRVNRLNTQSKIYPGQKLYVD